jgi:DNA relaxase NicK
MSKKRDSLKRELTELERKREQALEPIRKRRREKKEKTLAPFNAELEAAAGQFGGAIKNLKEMIKLEEEKSIWIVMRRSPHRDSVNLSSAYEIQETFRSAYLTKEEAIDNCPVNTRDHIYSIEEIRMNRDKHENKLEDSPPSR